MKRSARIVLATGACVALVAAGGVGGATAAKLITGRDIKDGTVQKVDLAEGVKRQLAKAGVPGPAGPQGPPGPEGPPGGDVYGGLEAYIDTDVASDAIAVGGDFLTNRTLLGELVVTGPGRFKIDAEALFTATSIVSGQTRLRLSLEVFGGPSAGEDAGTCYTDATSSLARRVASCSTSRIISAAPGDETHVRIYGFGLADDGGTTDSGKFTAQIYASAVHVEALPVT